MTTQKTPHSSRHVLRLAILAGIALFVFLILAPPGLLTKADMVGYAVCHRARSHSYSIGGRQLPLCARCTGNFLGALVGLLGQVVILGRRREAEFPPTPILLLLIGFIALMGIDGFNSYLGVLLGSSPFYEPRQWLRLVTGALNGLTISGLLLPLFNFSLWKNPRRRPAIQGWRDLAVLLALEGGLVALVLSGWWLLLYPLSLLSAVAVLTLLTLVNAVLVMMVTGWENRYRRYREALAPLLLGFVLALAQVGGIDLIRYALTGTLKGFPNL